MFTLLFAAMHVAAPADAPPVFTVSSAAEKSLNGLIVRMSTDFTLSLLSEGREQTVKNVFSLRRKENPLPPPPTGPQIITTTGDRIAGILTGGDAQSLKFFASGIKTNKDEVWRVPFSSASVIWLSALPAETSLDPARYDWLSGNRNRDVIRFRNGDINTGTLAGLDPDAEEPKFKYQPNQGTARTLRGDELSAVGFNPSLSRSRKPKGAYVQIILADSSRLALSRGIETAVLTGETLFGVKVSIPLSEVLSLDVLQGKATYLSDLKPKRVEQTGFLSVIWPWMADRSVQNTALRLMTPYGVSTFDKGLGTHPRTVLTYDLSGKYHWFEAQVGLDPVASLRVRANIRVLIDGKEKEVSGLPTLNAGTAIPIRLDVKGVKELMLVTDFGATGGVGADVNWCDARLVE